MQFNRPRAALAQPGLRGLARVLRRPEGRTSCAGPETARSCAGPRTARFVHAPARRSHVSVCPREYATWRQIMGIYGFQRLRLDCAGKDPISASRGRCGVRRGALSGAHAWRFSRCCYRGAPSPRTYVGRDLAAHVAKLRAVVAKTTARAARKKRPGAATSPYVPSLPRAKAKYRRGLPLHRCSRVTSTEPSSTAVA